MGYLGFVDFVEPVEFVGGGAPIVPVDVDIFLVAGQSNAQGRGTAAQSPAAPTGVYSDGSSFSALADPVGGANTGSMWPSFANEWFAQTGRRAVICEYAQGGTGLIHLTDPNWSPTGVMRQGAADLLRNTITAVDASPLYTRQNVYVLWVQGESDAQNINGTTVTQALYKDALIDLAEFFADEIPEMETFGVIMIGGTAATNGSVRSMDVQSQYFQQIRKAEYDADADSELITVLYPGLYTAIYRDYMLDALHPEQPMLNIAGKTAAAQLANPQAFGAIDPFIASESFPDSNATAKSSRTVSHTTAANTSCLVVAVAAHRLASGATFTLTATYNGVAMKQAAYAVSTGSTPNNRSMATVFVLDDALYGSSLANVTANIVVTAVTNTANVIGICAIDAKDVAVPSSEAGAFSTASISTDTLAATLNTFAPSLVVTVAAPAAASASALTATGTGTTEIMDSGQSNGTRAGMTFVGYSEEADPLTDKAISVQSSATLQYGALCVVALRQKVYGE